MKVRAIENKSNQILKILIEFQILQDYESVKFDYKYKCNR